jgi:hypothetical protein
MTPKKCGHYSGLELISIGQTTKNFEAAQRDAILTWWSSLGLTCAS